MRSPNQVLFLGKRRWPELEQTPFRQFGEASELERGERAYCGASRGPGTGNKAAIAMVRYPPHWGWCNYGCSMAPA
jgi:hypothetical protein